MNRFGSREKFAVEVGTVVDAAAHCQLDFYLCGAHLNRADNTAYVPAAAHAWPAELWIPPMENGAGEGPDAPALHAEDLLRRVLKDGDEYQARLVLNLGSVTDSFSMLVFDQSADLLLLVIRNDDFTDGEAIPPQWRRLEISGGGPVHWLAAGISKAEFRSISSKARECLTSLNSIYRARTVPNIHPELSLS